MDKYKRWLPGSNALAKTVPREAEVPTPAANVDDPLPARVVTVQGADTGVGDCVCVGVGLEVGDGAIVLVGVPVRLHKMG
jgi:hypothetical protein